MVVHQNPMVQLESPALLVPADYLQISAEILILLKNPLAIIASGYDMVDLGREPNPRYINSENRPQFLC